jgi:hypothetical protein
MRFAVRDDATAGWTGWTHARPLFPTASPAVFPGSRGPPKQAYDHPGRADHDRQSDAHSGPHKKKGATPMCPKWVAPPIRPRHKGLARFPTRPSSRLHCGIGSGARRSTQPFSAPPPAPGRCGGFLLALKGHGTMIGHMGLSMRAEVATVTAQRFHGKMVSAHRRRQIY